MLHCPLRGVQAVNNSSRSVEVTSPYAVSVVTSSCRRPRNLIRVVDLRQRSGGVGRTGVQQSAVNFSVCLPPLFGNFNQVVAENISTFKAAGPRADSGVVRIDPLRFLAGCPTTYKATKRGL